MLALFQKVPVSFLDNLFTATSAISTTGLASVSLVDSYSWFGQLVVLILIQIGGVGYMTFTSFLLLSNKSKLTHWHQRVLNAEFSLPKGFVIGDFLKSVILFTLFIEVIGAFAYYLAFTQAGVDHNFAVWSSVFHSVSAFCTAGFGLYNNNLEPFAASVPVNVITSILAISGSLGFIVVTDFWNRLSGKTQEITYTTKVIIGVMIVLLLVGTGVIYYGESSLNPLSGGLRLMISFFKQ